MAILLEKSGFAKNLYDMMHECGRLRGGLARDRHGTDPADLLPPMSGYSGARLVTMGPSALPKMPGTGYDKKLALGAINAGRRRHPDPRPSILKWALSLLTEVFCRRFPQRASGRGCRFFSSLRQ